MATSKLTISIETDTIENAKWYAKQQHTSLSKLIQKYLQSIPLNKEETVDLRPKSDFPDWMQQLMLADKPISDFSEKEAYRKHIEKKYGV